VSDGVHILFHFNIVLQTQRDALYQETYIKLHNVTSQKTVA